MFVQFVKFVASPVFRKGIEAATGFFMGDNVNPAAKAYAIKAAGEEAARVPEAIAVAVKAAAVVQSGGAALGFTSMTDAFSAYKVASSVALTPWRLQHHARNIKYLDYKNTGCDYQFDQDDEDADLCVMRPS